MGRGALAVAVALATSVAVCACGRRPSDAELDRLRAEAQAANEAAAREHGQEDERATWTLSIGGRVARPQVLAWSDVASVHATEILTRAHDEDSALARYPTRWRGPRLDALVTRAGPAEDAREVTLVASDGFRGTVMLEDARRMPILLAYENEGLPLTRASGGPLHAAFPLDDHPVLRERYTGSAWVFYVTHLIVETPDPVIEVDGHVLDRAAIEALPLASIVETVGYRGTWPSEPVRLEGVRLRDLLASVGTAIAPGEMVRVRSIAWVTHGDARPTRIRAEDVLAEDVIVATHHGEGRERIPSRLGGPLVLAFPSHVAARLAEHDWLTFVDAISVER